MVVLNFTLTPEAASKIHDLLVCLGKFSDTVAIEARPQRVSASRSSSKVYFSNILLIPPPVLVHSPQFIKVRIRPVYTRQHTLLPKV